MFHKTPTSQRHYCKACGDHVMSTHPTFGLIDIYAATLPTLDFKPAVHVNYGESVLKMRDGLPKFRDMPAEMGGSSEQVAE